jgi:hypothetical protein
MLEVCERHRGLLLLTGAIEQVDVENFSTCCARDKPLDGLR